MEEDSKVRSLGCVCASGRLTFGGPGGPGREGTVWPDGGAPDSLSLASRLGWKLQGSHSGLSHGGLMLCLRSWRGSDDQRHVLTLIVAPSLRAEC